jgi:hypothetical protein
MAELFWLLHQLIRSSSENAEPRLITRSRAATAQNQEDHLARGKPGTVAAV